MVCVFLSLQPWCGKTQRTKTTGKKSPFLRYDQLLPRHYGVRKANPEFVGLGAFNIIAIDPGHARADLGGPFTQDCQQQTPRSRPPAWEFLKEKAP